MGGIKKYFRKEFQLSMFNLEHDDLSDFYLSAFQRNRSPVPLLCLRMALFLGCLGILLTSVIMSVQAMSFWHWLIFLTHWGVIMITITSGCGALLSLKAYLGGSADSPFGLLLYVQIYWVLFNITAPIAFLITIFYWSFLTGFEQEFAMDPVLDLFIHGINSVVMLLLMVFSRQSARLLHVIHSLVFGITYAIFSLIYYFAGGLSPFGEPFIYPMLDWSSPVVAVVTVVGTAIFLIIAHALIVFLSVGRIKLSKRFTKDTHSINIYNDAYN